MGRYQFLADMTLDAGTLGLTEVAAQLAAESARVSTTTGNLQIAAYATELLGQRDTVRESLGTPLRRLRGRTPFWGN